jgi:endonuclease YncB( thermonuclease family)
MATPLLSIVIPVWNASDGIRRIVSAILTQSFDDFELILVDDGLYGSYSGQLFDHINYPKSAPYATGEALPVCDKSSAL